MRHHQKSKRATEIATTIPSANTSDPNFLAMPPFLRKQMMDEKEAQEKAEAEARE